MQPEDIIDALGGSVAVAKSLGIESNTVGNWRKRGFPAWAAPHLRRLCEEQGVDPRDALDPQPPRRLSA